MTSTNFDAEREVKMDKEQLINILKALGFNEEQPSHFVCDVNKYKISVKIDQEHIENSTIHYGNEIKVWHTSVCNFKKMEHLVQLECVIRLLKKGYSPKSIELEKQFKLGHKQKGRLDVLIKKGNKAWAMIECKTFGQEYANERKKVLSDGGQIFSYFAQNRNPEIIGIYSSKIGATGAEYEAEFIYTKNLDKTGETKDIHQSWDKEFVSRGLFEESLGVYELTKINLRKKDLIELTKETGRGLFNSFAEILRRYSISDKSNAFNVIFNLFVCKIFDEDTKSEDEELDFQWKIGDNIETLISRLSQLYYQSLRRYLNLEIDEAYFPKTNDGRSIAIREFSFVEVNNAATFEMNGNILADVVKKLQKFRIKYSTKHQFLGEFFEQLLNIGVKQEAGQFFTPIPLARFILRSLPIDKIIQDKIMKKEPHILPFIIDNACGSGHFLTEAMTEVEAHFDSIQENNLSGQQKRYFHSLKNNYLWARDYIYGVEKDNRLAKTAKIAMFLNGDGDATIISGDGLDDFFTSRSYIGRLKSSTKSKGLNTFDIFVSNPPFSVDGFANTLTNGVENFSLYQFVGEKSSEIECFFIERMIQLLSFDGVAGIILPLSILNNNRSVYIHARKLLLLNCQVISIVELREKALMTTGTSVVILFLRKRNMNELSKILDLAGDNFGMQQEVIEKEKQNLKQHGYIQSDSDGSLLNVVINELEKEHNILIAFSGEKKKQEYFLGYRFSKARGREGLSELKQGLLIGDTERYDEKVLATRIYDAFWGKSRKYGPSELDNHLARVTLTDIVDSVEKGLIIKNPSSILSKKAFKIESLSPDGDFIDAYESEEITLNELISSGRLKIIQGVQYEKNRDEVPVESNVKVITASNIDIRTGLLDFSQKLIYLRNDFDYNMEMCIRKYDIVISTSSGSLKHLAKVALVTEKDRTEIIGGFLNIIRADSKELALALYYRFLSKDFREYAFSKKGQNINNINMNDVRKLKLKIPKNLDLFYKNESARLNLEV